MWGSDNTYGRDRGIAVEFKPGKFIYMTHEEKNRESAAAKSLRYLWMAVLLSIFVYSLSCLYVYDIRKQTGGEFMKDLESGMQGWGGKVREIGNYFM